MDPLVLILFYLLAAIFIWYCWTALARRLGYDSPGLIGLGMLVPIINFVVFLYLVFNESPNEQKLHGLLGSKADAGRGPAEQGWPEGEFAGPAVEERVTGKLPEPEEPPPTRCPACGAAITPDVERCPDCEIVLR
jgi:hypothetical protein